MNGQHFIEWFRDTLCKALPNPSVIVLDNAPYHNVREETSIYPTSSSNKDAIKDWLRQKNIPFNENELKVITSTVNDKYMQQEKSSGINIIKAKIQILMSYLNIYFILPFDNVKSPIITLISKKG